MDILIPLIKLSLTSHTVNISLVVGLKIWGKPPFCHGDSHHSVGIASGLAADRERSCIPPADSSALVFSSGPAASPAPLKIQHKLITT